WMYEGKNVGIGLPQGGGGSLRNVPTCAMADALGIFMATTRASRPGISAGHAISPPRTAIPAATAIMPRAVCLLAMRLPSRCLLDHSYCGHAAAAPPSVAKNFRRPMWLAM